MILQRRPTDYAHRNLFLQAMVGAHAWGARLEHVVARYGGRREGLNPEDVPTEATLAILGAMVLLRKIQAIEGLRGAAPTRTPTLPADLGGIGR